MMGKRVSYEPFRTWLKIKPSKRFLQCICLKTIKSPNYCFFKNSCYDYWAIFAFINSHFSITQEEKIYSLGLAPVTFHQKHLVHVPLWSFLVPYNKHFPPSWPAQLAYLQYIFFIVNGKQLKHCLQILFSSVCSSNPHFAQPVYIILGREQKILFRELRAFRAIF